jgi:hypothetical protein
MLAPTPSKIGPGSGMASRAHTWCCGHLGTGRCRCLVLRADILAALGKAASDLSLVLAVGRGERAREQHRRPGEDPRADLSCRLKGHPKEVSPCENAALVSTPILRGTNTGPERRDRLLCSPRLAVLSAASVFHILVDGTRVGDPCLQL